MKMYWRTAVMIAAVIMVGSAGLAEATTMTNPGFEDELTGWTVSGDPSSVFATDSYAGYTPPYGKKFAVVLAGCPTNSLLQAFSAEAGEVIKGSSFFQANDYLPYDDTGKVKIVVTSSGTQTTLFESSVSDVGSYGGTGWIPWSFTVPATGTYSIQAISTNAEDCAASSAVGLDIDPSKLPMDVTGIILTRAGANNDQAQFKLKNMTGIKAAAEAAVAQGKPVTFKIGTCGAPPIGEVAVPYIPNTYLNLTYLNLRYTVGNLDMLRCVFSTKECVLNLKGIDFDTTVLPGVLGSDVIVTLEVGDTVYVDSIPGGWKEFDSGAPGNWTKYRKD